MKAMILAAGFGTRLRPLTHSRPKALVPVLNKPLLEYAISYLAVFGVSQLVVNAHHHWPQVKHYLDKFSLEKSGLEIHLSIEEKILGTGGAIKKVHYFWDQGPFFLLNVDVLTNIDLKEVYNAHLESRALATLVVHNHPKFNLVELERDQRIKGFHQTPSPSLVSFTGVHVIEPRLLDLIPADRYYSIIDCYRHAIAKGLPIRGYYLEDIQWADIGTIESYVEANKSRIGWEKFPVGGGAEIAPSANLMEWSVIGRNCKIHKHAHVEESILWDDVEVLEGKRVVRSIVTDRVVVDRDLEGEIL